MSDIGTTFPVESSTSSNQSSPAFSESGHEVPPASDFETSFVHTDDDGEDGPDDAVDLPTELGFGWKQKLQEIDMRYDDDDDMKDAPPRRGIVIDTEEGPAESHSRPTHGLSAGDDASTDDEDEFAPKGTFRSRVAADLARIDEEFDNESGTSSHRATRPLASGNDFDDPFDNPLTRMTSNAQRTHKAESPANSLSSPSTRIRRVNKRRSVAKVSDSEPETAQHSSPQTSPGALHPIGTPKQFSSPSPPTTQEMAQHKGKERARSEETPVDEELPTLEMQKANAKPRGKRKDKEKRVKVCIEHVRLTID